MKEVTKTDHILLLDSGRSAIFIGLKILGVKEGDEVILQAYTCIVVENAIKALGAVPIYIDIEEGGLTMDVDELSQKISKKTRAIIVQHTFGNSAKTEKIKEIADSREIKIIEDCAHSLGSAKNGRVLGSVGDMSIYSFGREKVVSASRGGCITTNKQHLGKKLEEEKSSLKEFPVQLIVDHLLSIILLKIGRTFYHKWYLGKIFLKAASTMRLVKPILDRQEKQGHMASWTPRRYANALAHIICKQLDTLKKDREKRFENAAFFQRELGDYLEFPQVISEDVSNLRLLAISEHADELIKEAQNQWVYLGDWYRSPVAPGSKALGASVYQEGSCPRAEQLAKQSLNIPIHQSLSKEDLNEIASRIKDVYVECTKDQRECLARIPA